MLLILVFALLGLFTGSFLNVCIDRLPKGQSIINPPSHCSTCNHKLGILDLVPVFSYLWLRGHCRYCKASIPIRLPIVEITTSLLFTFLYWKFGLGLELGISLVYACLLTVIFVIDLENQLVLDKVVYPGMALALAFSFFWPGLRTFSFFWPAIDLESALLGGVIGLAIVALIAITYPPGMGWGDVKLAALVGLMT
ncbi:MAG: prepilin peptidase, partial [Chloroflexota bacterium]